MAASKIHSLDAKVLSDAEKHLSRADPVMARLITDYEKCSLAGRKYLPFHTLASSIISQQLSSKAADTIKARLSKIVPMPFTPEGFLNAPIESLRTAGISQAKARYIRELADQIISGRLRLDRMAHKDDDTIINTLMELPGIGRWTAEMFLIFGLKRPDVLAIGDAGLQRAARLLYGNNREPDHLLEKVGKAWSPYSSVASWYLWRFLDGPD